MSRDCPRFGKMFKGCNFEGRYDKGPANADLHVKVHAYSQLLDLAEKARKVTYVRDVCTTCGEVIER